MKPAQLKLKARDVMNPKVTAATRRAVGRDLVLKLMSGGYSGLPVVEREGEVIGVVTELDLLQAALDGKNLHTTTAEELMGLPALCVDEETTVEEVMRHMLANRFLRVPVVRKGKLVGIISRSDILSHLIEPEFVTVSSTPA